MKKTGIYVGVLLFVCLLFLSGKEAVCSVSDDAQPQGKFNIGIFIPAGITLKFWTKGESAFDLKASWGTEKEETKIFCDYLWHKFDFFKEDFFKEKENTALYYGVGGKIQSCKEHDKVGLRFVFGIDFIFTNVPFDLFIEISPTLLLSPETELEIEPAIGLRYIFR